MTGSSGGQPDQHRKGELFRRQSCSPDAEWGLAAWALWFRCKECDAESWWLVADSWDRDWRRSNHPWGSFYVLVDDAGENTVARLCIDESVRPNETSSGSSDSGSRHHTPWKHPSRGWENCTRCLFRATSWTASMFQHRFPHLPFTSWRVAFSRNWLLPLQFCRLSRVNTQLWRSENDTWRPPCSSMLHHGGIYIEDTYRILTMPMCTQLWDWLCNAEQGFRLMETGLQLYAGTGSFLSSPSHSIGTLPHMIYFLVWGHGE